MTAMHSRLLRFRDRYPLLGPLFWLLSIQYFVIQVVVAHAWTTPYSLRLNVISDLGNTACGQYAGRYVCSPDHVLMNTSFISLGVTMLLGALLIPSEFRRRPLSRYGFIGMGLAGLGVCLVGLFPENTIPALHFLGALLPFALGNLALLMFATSLDLPIIFRGYTWLSAVVALAALVLFLLQHYFWFGQGGIERVIAYPQTIWLILFGVYMSMNHYRRRYYSS